jgi:MFS family permease
MLLETAVTSRTLRRGTAIGMYLLIALSYVVNGMDRSVFSNLVKSVTTQFHLSLAEGGLLSTVYAIGFGLTGIVAGYLLDRWARKSIMIIGIAVYSVFTLLMPLSHGFWDMTTYRVITGIGEAMQQTAIFTIAGVYFARHRNAALGGLNAAYGLGSFVGPLLGTQIFLMASGNWRPPLYVFGALGLVFAALAMVVLSSEFSEYGKQAAREPAEVDASAAAAVPRSWLNRNVVLLSVSNMMIGILNYGYVGMYPTFLKSELHFSPAAAAFAQSWYGIGAITGIVAGYLGDRFGERRLVYLAVVGSAVSGLLMFDLAPHAQWQQVVLSFLFGTFGSGFLFVNVYAMTQKAVRTGSIGKASGIASSAHYLGAGFSGALFGAMVDAWNWSLAAAVQMVAIPAIAIVCIAFVRMSKQQPTGVSTEPAGV